MIANETEGRGEGVVVGALDDDDADMAEETEVTQLRHCCLLHGGCYESSITSSSFVFS